MNSEHVHLMIYFETVNRFYLWFSKFLIFTLNFVIHKITTYTKYCYNLSTIFILKLKRKKSTFSFLLLWSKFSQTLNVSYLNRCSFYISYFTSHFWQHFRIPFCRITFTVTTILLHPRNILSSLGNVSENFRTVTKYTHHLCKSSDTIISIIINERSFQPQPSFLIDRSPNFYGKNKNR